MFPPVASGGAAYLEKSFKVIRFARHGCTNRPFYHIVVMEVGSYDPIPNKHNEKLVALNFERIQYWLRKGATVSEPVEVLLGLCGFFPIHPTSYMSAWRKRKSLLQQVQDLQIQAKAVETDTKAS